MISEPYSAVWSCPDRRQFKPIHMSEVAMSDRWPHPARWQSKSCMIKVAIASVPEAEASRPLS
jgi:hypothetical protein